MNMDQENYPQCPVRGKSGDVTLNCYHRFDSNYQSPVTNNSNSMVASPGMVSFFDLLDKFGKIIRNPSGGALSQTDL